MFELQSYLLFFFSSFLVIQYWDGLNVERNRLDSGWTYRSHWRNVHDAMIHSDTMNTSSTVPGHIVISVFNTNLSCDGMRSAIWANRRKNENNRELLMHSRWKCVADASTGIKTMCTYLVLKLIRFNAPMLRDDASVNNFECNSITRHIRYKRRNIGNDRATSYGTMALPIALFLFANLVVHSK